MMNKFRALLLVAFLVPSIVFSQVSITATGASNTFDVNYPANITAVSSGMMVTFFSNQTVTGNTFLNLNGLGSKSILKNVSQQLTFGDILSGQPVTVIYDGTNWQLLSTTANSSNTNLWTVSGVNLQPQSNSLNINISTTTGTYRIGGIEMIRMIENTVTGQSLYFGGGGNVSNTGYTNITMGRTAGSSLTNGYSNIFIGNTAGQNNTTGNRNVFIGDRTGESNFGGVQNSFYGALAGISNNSGNNNTFLGYSAGYLNSSGSNNTFIGSSIAFNNNGNFNTFIGFSAGGQNKTGSNNVFLGDLTGSVSSGSGNNFLGSRAGFSNGTGSNNIAIGYMSDFLLPNLSNAIAIGYLASVGGNNMMALGGVGSNAVSVGIGTATPQNTLHVVGGARISNLSLPGAVFSTASGDLYISTTTGILGSGAAGGVAYWSAANTLTSSSSNFFWDNTNGRLGIGNASPTSALAVNGAITVDNGNTNDGTSATFPTSAIRLGNTNSVGIASQKTVGNNQNGIDFWSGSSIRMQIQTNGNIGFGGSFAATSRLHLGEFSNSATYLKVSNNNTLFTATDGSNFGIDVSGNTEIRNYESAGINFFTNNLQRMSIGSTGVVQINNLVGPGVVQADASGNLSIGTALSGIGSTGAVTFWNGTGTLSADGSNLFWDNTNKRLGLGINTPSYQFDQKISAITGQENLAHYFVSDAPAEFFLRNASVIAGEFIPQFFGNQIGIGSALILSGETNNDSNPNDPEMVVVNGTFSGGSALGFKPLFAVKNAGSNRFQVSANGGITIASLTSGGTNLVQANAQGKLSLATSASYNLWTVSGSNIFPQSAASNLGIGLGSATAPGLIAGASRYITLAANQTNTTGYPSVELFSINGTLNSPVSKLDFINVYTPALSLFANHARIQAFTGRGAVSNGQLGFFTFNGTLNEVMRINENGGVAIGSTYTPTSPPGMGLIVQGNVGIGTTAPTRAILEQNGTVGQTSAIFGGNTSGISLKSNWPGIGFNGYHDGTNWKGISAGFVGGIEMDPSSGTINFNAYSSAASANATVSGANVLTILNSGNIGIGATIPSA
ncbi:MAG: hypothetical protein K2Q22_03235, partial [Cytophagales bacterium]|nr:hypothetical protein [Cytophagales bacterium]